MKTEKSLNALSRCPCCGNSLSGTICGSCGSTIYDFCSEHVRNHNGKTYIRFITSSGVAEVIAQVSSHKINIDNSEFPNSYIRFDAFGDMVLKEIAEN